MDQLERELSHAQFREWQSFFSLEPWGAEMEFWRAGIIASTVANVSPNRKQNSAPLKPKDFMPDFQIKDKPKSEQAAFLADLQTTFAGRIKKNDKDDDQGSAGTEPNPDET